jgi:hypothetical protein
MPDQRRGGRKPATPNRRTLLIERILALAESRPVLSLAELLMALSRDQSLPGDTRFKIIDERLQKLKAKRRKVPEELEALLLIVQDAQTGAHHRRRAAGRLAVILLPKKVANRRWRYGTGRYGFKFNVEIAREYRDTELRLRELNPEVACSRLSATDPEFVAIKSKIEEMRKQLLLRPAPPEHYGQNDISDDRKWLHHFGRKRADGKKLSEAEDKEEAECRARYDSYAYGPEQMARERRATLESWQAQIRRDNRERGIRKILRPHRQAELRTLRLLYPDRSPTGEDRQGPDVQKSSETRAAIFFEQHPFQVDEPCADGLFWSLEIADLSIEQWLETVKSWNARRTDPLTFSLVKDGVVIATSSAQGTMSSE